MRRERQITIERFGLPLTAFQKLEKQSGESGRFRALASAFENVIGTYPYRTKIRKGAFARTIRERGSQVKILHAHSQDVVPIGQPLELTETDHGLEFTASLNETAHAKDWALALEHAKSLGRIGNLEVSIGFDSLQELQETDPETDEVFRIVTELRLWEISLVPLAADSQAKVLEAASLSALLATPRAYERHRARELEEIERHERELFAPRWSCVQ